MDSSDSSQKNLTRLEGLCLESLVNRLSNKQLKNMTEILKQETEKRLLLSRDILMEECKKKICIIEDCFDIRDVSHSCYGNEGNDQNHLIYNLRFSTAIDFLIDIKIHLSDRPWISHKVSTDLYVLSEIIGNPRYVLNNLKTLATLSNTTFERVREYIEWIIKQYPQYHLINDPD